MISSLVHHIVHSLLTNLQKHIGEHIYLEEFPALYRITWEKVLSKSNLMKSSWLFSSNLYRLNDDEYINSASCFAWKLLNLTVNFQFGLWLGVWQKLYHNLNVYKKNMSDCFGKYMPDRGIPGWLEYLAPFMTVWLGSQKKLIRCVLYIRQVKLESW